MCIGTKKAINAKKCSNGKKDSKAGGRIWRITIYYKVETPINTQIYSAAIKAVLENANLCWDELEQIEYFSPHCFRHYFATWCFEAGIKPKTVQQYLGYPTLQMTMDLYTHVLKEHSMEDMSKLQKVLGNTLDVSKRMINGRFDKFLDMDKD